MGDIIFYCPLCCRKEFDSKKSLIEHLSSIVFHTPCPVCDTKYSSVERLIEHLKSDNCEAINTRIEYSNKTEPQNNEINECMEKAEMPPSGSKNCDMEGNITAATVKFPSENNMEVNKMYVELLSKQLAKPCLQTQELKLVLEDGESRYVVLTNNDSVENICTDNAVVTKQNNDGTISLTTVNGAKPTDSSLTATHDSNPKTESEENSLEIYSCNTCGVSFSSVIDHIQNFHNDQDVVVEEPLDETPGDNAVEIKEDTGDKTDILTSGSTTTNDRLPLRRMITETGDIIETPVILKDASEPSNQFPFELALVDSAEIEVPNKTICIDKQGQVTKGWVSTQKDKVSNSNMKNVNEEEKSGLYHKVVLQELVTTTGNKVKIYNCISCNLFVPTLAEFKSRPCLISNKYTCPHCPVAYENHKSLCAHMKIHKSKEVVFDSLIKLDLECAICGTVFPTRKSLKLHKRMHDPIKSRPIEPPVQTNEGQVASEDKYLCTICDKMIPIDYRAIHQNSHNNTNKMNCHICNKKFNSREYLDMHMSVHNQDKVVVGKQDKSLPYTCMYCNRQFARPHEKVKHERIHTGEKPHSCEICGKSFRVSYCLTLHMRTHTGARPYTCPHCGKRFKAHSVYNHHLLTHSEVRAYKCPFCPKAFKTSVQLAGHKNSHTKPFSCQQCNRPFASLYAVRVHMDSHLKQNSLKFSCSLCGASYARAFALKDHVRQVHQADMEAADALSGLKEEEWLVGDDDKESIRPLHRDLNQEKISVSGGPLLVKRHSMSVLRGSSEINVLEMNADELIIP